MVKKCKECGEPMQYDSERDVSYCTPCGNVDDDARPTWVDFTIKDSGGRPVDFIQLQGYF